MPPKGKKVEKVSETEEKQIRNEIEEIIRPRGAKPKKLHIIDEETKESLCGYSKGNDWRREPVDAWPIGHTELCPSCADEHFEHR